jgi:hypothetical protein
MMAPRRTSIDAIRVRLEAGTVRAAGEGAGEVVIALTMVCAWR